MIIGIDPKVDYAFKRIFGRDNPLNHRLLISLLAAVLRLSPAECIIEVQQLNPFHEREVLDYRLAIVDVKVRDQRGRQFTVEMQMLLHPFLAERLTYYWAKLYPQPLTTGKDYDALRPTFVICFLNDVLWPAYPEQHHWRFQLRDERSPAVVLTAHEEIHVLELPKFQRNADELVEPLDQWIYFLQHAEEIDTDHLPRNLALTEVREALGEFEMLSKDQLERERYEAHLRVQRDESIRARAPQLYEEAGYKRGLAEAIRQLELGLNREATPREQLLRDTREGLEDLLKELQQHAREKPPLVELIQRFQRGLKHSVSSRDELLALTLEQLRILAEQLEQEAFGPPADSSHGLDSNQGPGSS